MGDPQYHVTMVVSIIFDTIVWSSMTWMIFYGPDWQYLAISVKSGQYAKNHRTSILTLPTLNPKTLKPRL